MKTDIAAALCVCGPVQCNIMLGRAGLRTHQRSCLEAGTWVQVGHGHCDAVEVGKFNDGVCRHSLEEGVRMS